MCLRLRRAFITCGLPDRALVSVCVKWKQSVFRSLIKSLSLTLSLIREELGSLSAVAT